MKSLVIYDSFFGNTKKVAEEIAQFLESDLFKVNEFNRSIDEYDLIVIGSPTRGFRPTKGIVSFTKKIPKESLKLIVIFDTRMKIDETTPKILKVMVKKFGYSNDTLLSILEKKKIKVALEPIEVFVENSEGPLSQNEIERVLKLISTLK